MTDNQGTLVIRHLSDGSGHNHQLSGPRFGEMSRSAPCLHPVVQAMQRRSASSNGRSLPRDSLELATHSLGTVYKTPKRLKMQTLRHAGCMTTGTDWYKPACEAPAPDATDRLLSTATAFYAAPTASLPAKAQMSRSFVNLISSVPVHIPELKPLHFGCTYGRRFQDGPPVVMKAADGAFWPKVSSLTKEGVPSVPLQRSLNLMDTLYDMRRLRGDQGLEISESSAAAEPSPADEEEEEDAGESLLNLLLTDLNDTEADLRVLEKRIAETQGTAAKQGGARHPSSVQCSRTLAAIGRKAGLLHDVEKRSAEFLATSAKRQEILLKVASDSGEVPMNLKGLEKFVRDYTHRPGQPVEASRSDFAGFVCRLRLPSAHSLLTRLTESADEFGEWWADACLDYAEKGAEYEQLQRLLKAAVDCGADEDHFKMHRARKLVTDRLAEDVLQKAQARVKKDKLMVERTPNKPPPPGAASKAADDIETDLKKATSKGVPFGDKRLVDSRTIASELRQLDGERKRLANREARLVQKGK